MLVPAGRPGAFTRSESRLGLPETAAWLAGFAPILLLALEGGGFAIVGRSQVGIAIWWLVGAGCLTGAIALGRPGGAGRVACWSLAALVAWTGASLLWTESTELSVTEIGRIATYAGFVALGFAAAGTGRLRWLLGGLAGAIVAIAALGVASRTVPGLVPETAAAAAVGAHTTRLSFPITYWNGLGAVCALGLPLLLHFATTSRRVLMRSLAAGAIPLLCLCAFLTASRGSAYEAVIAVGVYLVLARDRLHRLATVVPAAAASVLVAVAADQRPSVLEATMGEATGAQGRELLALVLVACAATALLQAGFEILGERARRPGRRATSRLRRLPAAAAALLVVAALLGGAPGRASHAWEQFKRPPSGEASLAGSSLFGRLRSSDAVGRYQLWQSALAATKSAPLTGLGAGTFELWWSRNPTLEFFVRDAHSLYLGTSAELGWTGLALLTAFILAALMAGLARARAPGPATERDAVSAALATCAAFLVAAAIDWVWQLAAVAGVFLLIAGALLVAPGVAPRAQNRAGRPATRLVSLAGAAAIAATLAPLAGSTAVLRSQEAARAGRPARAIELADQALSLQPYSVTALMQRALVLREVGDLDAAHRAARRAARIQPTNWRPWLLLSRLDVDSGRIRAALAAYRRAMRLNRYSDMFPSRSEP